MNNFDSLATSFGALIGMSVILMIILLAVVLVLFIALWKIFTKAGKPGWASLIPVYNTVILAKIAGQPWWYGLMPLASFIPFIGWLISLIFIILIYYKLAIAFGQDAVFAIGLILLPIVFLPILAFNQKIKYTLQ